MSEANLQAILLTLELAGISTLILLAISLPLAWWLARSTHAVKSFIEAVVALPLVLPPTVLGFYLLILLSPNSPLGAVWVWLTGESLTFSFSGLVVGSVIYSLPFVVQPLQAGFMRVTPPLIESAALLGAGALARFRDLVLPMVRPTIVAAAALGFAHTIGEFGVVLMIGGNIPGETRVLSIAIFDHVEALRYGEAHALAAGLLAASLVMLTVIYRWARPRVL
ncbi:MAG: molybdate ABC transporter permease subunit [Gammaproteobacteria bacterium]|jgi:molybdate transport system permease protein